MKIRFIPSFALVIVLTGCFMPASIQNRYNARHAAAVQAAAEAEWNRVDRILANEGWQTADDPISDALQERYDESDVHEFDLPARGTYAMVGFCDDNCVDMDLEVFKGGSRVAEDLELDARPMAVFQGAAGERVSVRVTIPNCRAPRVPGQSEDPLWFCAYFTRLYIR